MPTHRLSWSLLCYFLIAYGYCCIVPVMTASAETEDVLRQRVLAMWQNRQDSIKSLRVIWAQERTDTKGGIYRRIDNDYVALPREDTTYHGDCRMLIQEGSSFYEYKGLTLHLGSGQYLPTHMIFAFDGVDSKSLNKVETPGGTIPSGAVYAEPGNFITRGYDCLPLLWYCRPLDAGMGGLSLDEVILRPRSTSLNGRPAIKIDVVPRRRPTVGATSGTFYWTLWIDPQLDGNVIRAERQDNNNGRVQFEVAYQLDPAGAVKPQHWRFTRQKGVNVIRDIQGLIETCELNVDIPIDAFELKFPVGAIVSDNRESAGQIVIQRDGGRIRPILPSEYGTPYKELLESEAPSLFVSAYNLAIGLLGVFVFIGIAWLAVRACR